MVERSLSMREVPGSIPGASKKVLVSFTQYISLPQIYSPVTGSSKLLYSSRVGPKSEILLLCPLEDENQSRPTLFQHFPVIEAKKIAKNLRFAQH